MKFIKKQRARQAMCKREINREKRLIRLMHEKYVLDNFRENKDYMNMYNNLINNTLNQDGLSSSDRKVYNTCQKYIMYNDFKELDVLQEKIENLRDRVNGARCAMNEERENMFNLKKMINQKRSEEKNYENDKEVEVNTLEQMTEELNELRKEYEKSMDKLNEKKNRFNDLREKYSELREEYYEFKRELTNNEEGRRLYNLCKSIESLKKYD